MTIEEIKELIQLVTQTGIAELEVQRAENRVRIKRSNSTSAQEIVLSPSVSPLMGTGMPSHASSNTSLQTSTSAHVGLSTPAELPPIPAQDLVYVKSPIVGTFYESSAPGSAAFVKVGDRVTPGQTMCIIESMKLMNEIESEVAGIVVSRLVENGRPVEYGESLFAVQPS